MNTNNTGTKNPKSLNQTPIFDPKSTEFITPAEGDPKCYWGGEYSPGAHYCHDGGDYVCVLSQDRQTAGWFRWGDC